MKQTPLPRTSELRRNKPMKRSAPKRDWTDARAKVEAEGRCRLGPEGCEGKLEAAHIVGRAYDQWHPHKPHVDQLYVNPDSIAVLCTRHHREYDLHQTSILETLTTDEQVRAVADTGSILTALKRTTGERYVPERWACPDCGNTDRRTTFGPRPTDPGEEDSERCFNCGKAPQGGEPHE